MSHICQILCSKTDPFLPPEIWYMVFCQYEGMKTEFDRKNTVHKVIISTCDYIGYRYTYDLRFTTKQEAVDEIHERVMEALLDDRVLKKFVHDKDFHFWVRESIEAGETIEGASKGSSYTYEVYRPYSFCAFPSSGGPVEKKSLIALCDEWEGEMLRVHRERWG